MSGISIWVIAAVALVVIIAVVILTKRRNTGPEPTLDPPYNQKKFPDPTAGDPQVVHEADPGDVRYPDGPDNIRNPDVDHQAPGPSTPRSFRSPGPPHE